ncbi:MAG TPA: N-acetylmuramoyl-L-alanine amidase [Porphyromonadaceae bacterium]|nr:N-acetylmuramoyl-L-alanine amidase [Porphyromonadaceae bacterium]
MKANVIKKNLNIKVCCFLFCAMGTMCVGNSQTKSKLYLEYIDAYASLAQEQQKQYKIPSSITLAQGILESGAGTSWLATTAKNHFGIKCHKWDGQTVTHTDDEKDECFRKYFSVTGSYKDHSLFLTSNSRYAPLFQLKITDYKGWAKGLKNAGYATSSTYATRLIDVIELYELYKYDVEESSSAKKKEETKFADKETGIYPIVIINKLECVLAHQGDKLTTIANAVDVDVKDLAKYNEVSTSYVPQKNEPIFLEKKRRTTNSASKAHIVRQGESMHSISQMYGIRIKSLCKLNEVQENYTPKLNEVLRLRM